MDTVQIDYDKLAADYWENLTTVLRGFNAAPEYEFLETWVHHDDPAQSILNIVNAAADSGLPGVSISIGASTLQGIDVENLKAEAEQIGRTSIERIGDAATLDVQFAANDPFASANASYREGFRRAAARLSHEGSLQAAPPLIKVEVKRSGVTLAALVDPESNVVTQSRHQGAARGPQTAVLEELCAVMEGLPIQECSDHAMIRTEHRLRDHTQPRPVSGIVIAEAADPAFREPTALVRDLASAYFASTAKLRTANTFALPPRAGWSALTPAQRVERLSRSVAAASAGDGTVVERLEDATRVVVSFTGDLDRSSKQHRLMRLESFLKAEVEPAIQLYLEPRTDQNKLRRIKID